MVAVARNEMLGKRLGRYILRYTVARGGMGTVYLAQLPGAHRFEKWVAIKLMHEHLADDDTFVKMFLDEANLAAGIRHPNVCQIQDFGEQNGIPYIVMEYLHGETLSSVIRHGWGEGQGVPHGLVARVVSDIAHGLHAAHELKGADRQPLNLVHRDVSPQNMIVLYDGMAKITDFGVARAEGRRTETTGGEVKGKFAYMSPEQLQGGAIDRRADVWGLGVVLWEATMGRRLFRAESEGQTAIKVIQAPIERPSAASSDFPPALEAAILGALERDPNARTPTAAALADQLDAFIVETRQAWGAAQVGRWMCSAFEDRRQKREEMLRVQAPLETEVLPEVELESQSTLGSRLVPHVPAPVEPDERGRFGIYALFAALLAAGTAIGWFAMGAADEDALMAATEAGSESESETEAGTEPGTGTETEAEAGTGTGTGTETGAGAGTEAGTESESGTGTGAGTGTGTGTGAGTGAESETGAGAGTGTGTGAESGAGTSMRRRRRGSASPMTEMVAAVPTRTGTLNVLAIPSAIVSWNGRRLGETPIANFEMPAGRHRLLLRPTSGGPAKTITVTIRPGERTRRSVSLAAID